MAIDSALKEWAIAVDALTAGETIVLLRKGGIRERKFQVQADRVWLYPTYEHQKPDLLKAEYAKSVKTVESRWHPTTVEIKSYAEITDALSIDREDRVQALLPYHVWNERAIEERLKWKPQQPLIVLLLRVYSLARPHIVAYNDLYGGCKSWISLIEPISTAKLHPVITDENYDRLVREIKSLVR